MKTIESKEAKIEMAGLAGYPSGNYTVLGTSVVVKTSPILVRPEAGKWDFIQKMIERMLGIYEAKPDQVILFHAWMKQAMTPKRKGGLALVLAWPRDCGKSLLQHLIITPLLGGRNADPGPYMFGETVCNAELFGSEHLQMEDPAPKRGFNRQAFAEKLKDIVAINAHQFRRKCRPAVALAPKWHLSISINDDPSCMKIIPEMTPDIADKVLMLKVQRPYDGDGFALPGEGEREAFRDALKSQLPAYAHFLQTFEIPADYVGRRFGVKAWQNPTLAGRGEGEIDSNSCRATEPFQADESVMKKLGMALEAAVKAGRRSFTADRFIRGAAFEYDLRIQNSEARSYLSALAVKFPQYASLIAA